jgi:hypothetical protein
MTKYVFFGLKMYIIYIYNESWHGIAIFFPISFSCMAIGLFFWKYKTNQIWIWPNGMHCDSATSKQVVLELYRAFN